MCNCQSSGVPDLPISCGIEIIHESKFPYRVRGHAIAEAMRAAVPRDDLLISLASCNDTTDYLTLGSFSVNSGCSLILRHQYTDGHRFNLTGQYTHVYVVAYDWTRVDEANRRDSSFWTDRVAYVRTFAERLRPLLLERAIPMSRD